MVRLDHSNILFKSPTIKNNGHNKFDKNSPDVIKSKLLNERAINNGYNADYEFLSDNFSHYTYDKNQKSNHVVCIMDYDDNYSVNNFNVKPPKKWYIYC